MRVLLFVGDDVNDHNLLQRGAFYNAITAAEVQTVRPEQSLPRDYSRCLSNPKTKEESPAAMLGQTSPPDKHQWNRAAIRRVSKQRRRSSHSWQLVR